jgi:hypothetical protein
MSCVKRFSKSGAGEATFRDKAFKRTRGHNGGLDTRGMVAKDRKVTLGVGSWNAQDTIAFRDMSLAVSRDHSCSTGTFWGEASVGMKVGRVMSGGSLCTIIKMCTGTIKVKLRVGRRERGVGEDLMEKSSIRGGRCVMEMCSKMILTRCIRRVG